MNKAYVVNPFGAGKYELTGEKANEAAVAFEAQLERLNSNMSNEFDLTGSMEHVVDDGCITAISDMRGLFGVEVKLIY